MNGVARVALLLRKDLWLHFWAIVILWVLEMGSFLTFAAQFPPAMRSLSGGFLQGIAAIGTFMIGYRLLASEDSVGSLTFLKSLPLSTTEIFGAKILFMWGYVLLNSLTLNGGYLATRLLVPSWELGLISWGEIGVGIVIQLVFSMILVWVATWAGSQKAIWIPFPLLILLLNAYAFALSPSAPDNWMMKILRALQEHALFYSLTTLVGVMAAGVVIIVGLNRKRSLVG